MTRQVTPLTGQSVPCSLLTPRFQIDSDCLEPQWSTKQYLVPGTNGKLSKAVLSSYLWKRPIILNTTAYLSIVCILL